MDCSAVVDDRPLRLQLAPVVKRASLFVLVATLLVVGGSLLYDWVGDARPAEAAIYQNTVMIYALQAIWLFRIAPAFLPFDATLRKKALILPISRASILRRWFQRGKCAYAWVMGISLFAALGAVCNGVALSLVLRQLAWQWVLLAIGVQASYWFVIQRAQFSWPWTLAFW